MKRPALRKIGCVTDSVTLSLQYSELNNVDVVLLYAVPACSPTVPLVGNMRDTPALSENRLLLPTVSPPTSPEPEYAPLAVASNTQSLRTHVSWICASAISISSFADASAGASRTAACRSSG